MEKFLLNARSPPTLEQVWETDLKGNGVPGELLLKHMHGHLPTVAWRQAAKAWDNIAELFCQKFLQAAVSDPEPAQKPHPALFLLMESCCAEKKCSFNTILKVLHLFPSVQGAPTLSCAAKVRKKTRAGSSKPRYDEFFDVKPVLQYLWSTPISPTDEQAVRDRLLLVWRFAHLMRNVDQMRIPREHIQKVDDRTYRFLMAPKQPGRLVFSTRYACAVDQAPWWACPVRLLTAYLTVTKDVTDGYLFRYLPKATKSGARLELTASRIGAIIKDGLAAAGVDTKKYKPHATRGATVTFVLDERLLTPEEAMAWGNWKTENAARQFYFRHFRRENPFARVLQMVQDCRQDTTEPAGAEEDFPLPSPSRMTEHSGSEATGREPERKECKGRRGGEGRGKFSYYGSSSRDGSHSKHFFEIFLTVYVTPREKNECACARDL